MRKNVDPEPDREADPEAWETWFERAARRDDANWKRRQRRAALRQRFVYPPEPFYALAEQTVTLTVHRPTPLLPWELEMTVRFRTPGPDYPHFDTDSIRGTQGVLEGVPLPFPWEVPIFTAFNSGIRIALARFDHPVSEHGIDIGLLRLRIKPTPPRHIDISDLTRLAALVEAAATGAVWSLWGSLIAGWERDRHLDTAWVKRDLADFERPAE